MRWYPWMEFKGEAPQATNNGLPIVEPPCKECKHWNPQVTFRAGAEGQIPDGVRLCHADSMHRDFSCFKVRYSGSA